MGSSATLSGIGGVGALTVTGGNIAPGASPGTMTASSATFGAAGSYTWEINHAVGTAGAQWDRLSISGTLDVTATSANKFTISLVSLTSGNATGLLEGFSSAQNYTYTIARANGGILGFDTSDFTLNTSGFSNALNGGTWSLALSDRSRNLDLNFTASAIPEPSTYAALIGAGALAFAAWRRRRTGGVERQR